MPTIVDLYVRGVKKKFKNYYAAWLPTERFELGDVGILKRDLFTKVTNLKALRISFKTRSKPDPSPIDFVSDAGVSIAFKAAGETRPDLPSIPAADAGIGIEFGQEGAFLIKAPASVMSWIEDIATLQDEVRKAYLQGAWHPNWAAIVRLVTAPNATIMISQSAHSRIELSAAGTVPSGPVDLGNANINFTVKSQQGDLLHIQGAQNVSLLFQLVRIKSNFLGFGDVAIAAGETSPLDFITPQIARDNPAVANSLYLEEVPNADED